jgi:hypothetical protein
MFESSSLILSDIIKRKKEIQEKWELQVFARATPLSDAAVHLVDILVNIDGEWKPRGVYNLNTKEFTLFYGGLNTPLKRDKYIKIPSENFFDKIDDVYYRLYNDV